MMLGLRLGKTLTRASSVLHLQVGWRARHILPRTFSATRFIPSQEKPSGEPTPPQPIGVNAAIRAAADPNFSPKPTVFDQFSLADRVGIVSGGNRGIGLEMALVLCEAGARAVYCFDLPSHPSEEWQKTSEYVRRMGHGSRLEYVSANVTDQKGMWDKVREIGDREKRMDVCVAAAGILKNNTDCLEYPEEQFNEVMRVNANGVLYTAQAAGQQMVRFGNPGSIVMIASMSGSITNKDHAWLSYNTSKSAVLQMARSMACELGTKNIRVNTISPGHILTTMTTNFIETQPHLMEEWSGMNPLGRLARPDELRGVVAWLASDASSFCTGSDILVDGGYHSW